MQLVTRILLISAFIISGYFLKAQDLVYLNNGTKFEATVKEITTADVKYKNVNNPDGPTYIITKSDVLFIEYQNGTVEVINKNPVSLTPKSSTPTVGEKKEEKKPKPNDLYYINKNAIHLNALALTNADITLMFERDLANNHLSVMALGGYNFNNVTTWPNLYIKGSLPNTKKNYDLGLGINFFPSTRKKAQYFVGLLFKYMNYTFDREVTVEENIGGFIYNKIEIQKAEGYQFASMIVNGFQVRITPTITYKAFIGFGPFQSDSDFNKAFYNNGSSGLPKAYLGICIGYRF